MTDALEEYLTAPRPPKVPRDNPLKDLMTSMNSLPDIYQRYCKDLALKPDPTVMRLLERGIDNIEVLDLSTLVFSQQGFQAVMEMCRILTNLGTLNLANSNLKPQCVPYLTEMADEHPTLHSVDLSGNPGVGFAAAQLLLPLIKDNQRFIRLDVEGTGLAPPTKQLIRKVLDANRKYRIEQGDDLDALENPPLSPTSPKSMRFTNLEASVQSVAVTPKFDASQSLAPDGNVLKANEELQLQLTQNEEQLVAQYLSLAKSADEQMREVQEQVAATRQLVFQLTDGWKWPYTSQFQVTQCIDTLQLVLSESDIEHLTKMYTSGPRSASIAIRPLFDELLEAGCSRRRKQQLLKDVADKVKREGPGMPGHLEVVSSFVDILTQDGSTLEALKTMLKETQEQIEMMKTKVSHAEAARAEAVQREDLKAAEGQFETSLELQEEMIDLVLYRLNNLLDKASKLNLVDNLDKLHNQSKEQIKESRDFNADVLERLGHDLEKVEDAKVAANDQFAERKAKHQRLVEMTEAELAANQQEQDEVWERITQAFADLTALAQARVKKADDLIQGVQDYEGSRVDFERRMKVYEEHLITLQDLQRACRLSEETLLAFEDFATDAVKRGQQVASQSSSEGDHLAREEQKRYLALFRQFYMQLGELLFKKQKRLEEVDRMVRSCVFQIDFCKETLDPDLTRYREQLKDLQLLRVEVADKVNRLQIRGDSRATQFLPHEEKMRRAGLEFDSPLLEMHEEIAHNRTRVLEQRQKFLRKDKEELVDKEAMGIDELLQTTKTARVQGPHTLLSPRPGAASPKTPKSVSVASTPAAARRAPGSPAAAVAAR
eukprot:EG_transcript_2524